MNARQARTLHESEQVCWDGDSTDTGTVIERMQHGVLIRWDVPPGGNGMDWRSADHALAFDHCMLVERA